MTKTSQAASPSSSTAEALDAIAMLVADHRKVKDIFKQFSSLKEESASEETKSQLVMRVCGELRIHAQLEEEIFYPAVPRRSTIPT